MKKFMACLTVAAVITTNSVAVFANTEVDLANTKAATYSVKTDSSVVGSILGSSIKYVKSELKGQDATIFTVTRGKYKPINLLEFLKHEDVYEFSVVSQEKNIYITEDISGTHTVNVNTEKASMEPVVLELTNGKKVIIRFSNEFLQDNKIPLADGHELFERGYTSYKDIKGETSEITYIDFVGDKRITISDSLVNVLTTSGEIATFKVGGKNRFDYNSLFDSTTNKPINVTEKDDIFGSEVKDKTKKDNKEPGNGHSNISTISDGYEKLPTRGGLAGIGDAISNMFPKLGNRGESPIDGSNNKPGNKPGNNDLNESFNNNFEKDKDKGKGTTVIPSRPTGKDSTQDKGDVNEVDPLEPVIDGNTRQSYKHITQDSTKEEVSELDSTDLTLLYGHAMKFAWTNSLMIHEVYLARLETLTQEEIANLEQLIKGPNPDLKPEKKPDYSKPTYVPDIWGGGDEIASNTGDCYSKGYNEIELQNCLNKTGDALDFDYWTDDTLREDTNASGTVSNTEIVDIESILNGKVTGMTDDEIKGAIGNGYNIDDILSGDLGGKYTKKGYQYELEFGKMLTDQFLKDAVDYEEEQLLLSAYQELQYNVYNEKMESINPNTIPIIEPTVKKIVFVSYSNEEIKSKLILKYVSFFSVLILMTLAFLTSSRTIQDEKRKETFKNMLKFREEAIIFTDYINDEKLGVE